MSVVERFLSWAEAVVTQRQDVTGGMPFCPYAGKALREGKVHIEEMAYSAQELGPILDRVAWLQAHPLYDVLVLLHPDRPCPAREHRDLEDALRPLALRLGQHTFGYHVDDPTHVASTSFVMPVCGLQFQPEQLVQEARAALLRGHYYDKFTVAELKDLGFFQ